MYVWCTSWRGALRARGLGGDGKCACRLLRVCTPELPDSDSPVNESAGGSGVGRFFGKDATYSLEGSEKLRFMLLEPRAAVCVRVVLVYARMRKGL